MRTFILYISLFISTLAMAQDNSTKTITLSVKGNCEECKARIENAADIKGVKLATWDEKTQIATVIYNADKITALKIEQAIAASGHDAGNTKGDDSKYKKLPSCCKYRDKKCEK
jgi:hypothetical protein